MQEMAHWSPQRAPDDPGAPISALYPGLRSARHDVFPHSTGLEVQRPDRLDLVVHPAKITRLAHDPSARTPKRLPFIHPTITVSRANGTTQPQELTGTVQFLESFRLPPRRFPSISFSLASLRPSGKHRTSASNPCRFPQPIPFAVALSLLLPLIDLGASLKPPCGVQSISPATTRSRCPPHSCT